MYVYYIYSLVHSFCLEEEILSIFPCLVGLVKFWNFNVSSEVPSVEEQLVFNLIYN